MIILKLNQPTVYKNKFGRKRTLCSRITLNEKIEILFIIAILTLNFVRRFPLKDVYFT